MIRTAILQVVALMCVAIPGNAQSEPGNLTGHSEAAAVNAALGGITAGTWQALSGKPFWPAFARGAGAGLAVYAGKWIISNGRPISWWSGRQLAAIGSSEVANAAHGRGVLQEVILPVGPIRIHVDRLAKQKAWASVDLSSTAASVVIGMRSGHHLGIDESLATGAIVFIAPEVSNAVGGNAVGVITVSELAPDGNFPPLEGKRSIISHELIHSAQYDFSLTAWSDGAEAAIARKFPRTRRVLHYIDLNLTLPVQFAVNEFVDYDSRPWEREVQGLVNHDR